MKSVCLVVLLALACANVDAVGIDRLRHVKAKGCGGKCQTQSSCKGTVQHGLCPGAANIICCTAKPVTPAKPAAPASGSACMNARGLNLIKGFEGFRGSFYLDSVGVKTIGYGHACQPASACNSIHAPLSEAQAASLLATDLATRYEGCVKKITHPLNNNQFAALTSFVYNLGCGVLSGNLLSYLNSGNFASAESDMLQYDHAGGAVLAGLKTRREAEVNLMKTAISGTDGTCVH